MKNDEFIRSVLEEVEYELELEELELIVRHLCLFSFLSNRFQCILILFDDKFGYLFHNQSTIAMSTAKRRQSFKKCPNFIRTEDRHWIT